MDTSALIIILAIIVHLPGTFGLEIIAFNENEIVSNECALGLPYWCQDLQTAKRCRAVTECIQIAWENKFPPDNSEVCTTCKDMVEETRNELRNETSQKLFKELLDNACNKYFHTDVIVKECVQQVDKFIFELQAVFSSKMCVQQVDKFIFELQAVFSSKMDSNSVCSVTLFCNSEILSQLIEDYLVADDESRVSDACQDCKMFAIDAVATTKSMKKDVFRNKLITLCNGMQGGFIKKQCVDGMKRNSDKLYKYITTKMTPASFCAFATMCAKEGQLGESQSDNPGCVLCLEMVKLLKEILVQDEFKADLYDALITLCSKFGSLKQQCETYFNLYFMVVYDYIVQQLDPPLRLCQIINICNTKESFNEDYEEVKNFLMDASPGMLIMADSFYEFQDSVEETLGDSLESSESTEETIGVSDTCQHCQAFAIDAVAAVKKLGKGSFKKKLYAKCRSFHVSKFGCNLAVKKNGDRIFKDITTKVTPNNFCSFTTMCGNGFDDKNTEVDDFKCVVCQQLVKEMRDFLALNSTRNAVHNVFLPLCSILGPFEKQCTGIMNDKYFGIAYKFFILALEPQLVCHQIGFCVISSLDVNLDDYASFYDAQSEETYTDYDNGINW